jgi:hypothetical protein
MVERIHQEGFKAQLWWSPLSAVPNSKLLTDEPDLILEKSRRFSAQDFLVGFRHERQLELCVEQLRSEVNGKCKDVHIFDEGDLCHFLVTQPGKVGTS